jgi:hypothetical protein
MKLLLLTTAIIENGNTDVLDNMLESVAENMKLNTNYHVDHVVLLQKCTKEKCSEIEIKAPPFVTFLSIDNIISLSEARNRLFHYVFDASLIEGSSIVAFPDDDCWFPVGNLNFVINQFQLNKNLDFFFCKYGSSTEAASMNEDELKEASISDVVRNASSNTIFIRGRVALQIGGFDINLGVGTENNGGEDLDYAIRAYLASEQVSYLSKKIVGHRDKNNELRGKYYRGSTIVLKRYSKKSVGLMYEFLRKACIGLVLMVKNELSWTEFLISMRYNKPLIE